MFVKASLPSIGRAGMAFYLGAALCWAGDARAATEAQGARVTRVIGEVKIAAAQNAQRAASLNARITDGDAIRTSANARTELTFPDQTLARFGANTLCNLTDNSRSLQLNEGAVLFQAPDSARGGVKVKTGGITISIKGTTGIVERYQDLYVKILVLEGTARVYLNKLGESVLVKAGQLLITKPGTKSLPEAVHFEIAQLYKTSLLTSSDFSPLASRDKIFREIKKQESDPAFIRTNLVIHGRGTLVNLVPPTPTPGPPVKPAAAAAATKPSSVEKRK